jgi:hypothetical protein
MLYAVLFRHAWTLLAFLQESVQPCVLQKNLAAKPLPEPL